jgi:hypothetical protein
VARLADLPETLTWAETGEATVSFDRAGGFRFLAKPAATPVPLSHGVEVVLSSGPLDTHADGRRALPRDTYVWLQR